MPQPKPDESNANESATPRKLWRDLHLWQIQPVRDVLVVLLIVGVFWLGSVLSLVTVPLLLAILLAYLVEPIIAWVTKSERISRSTAAAGMIVASGLVVVVPVVLVLAFGITQGVESVGKVRRDIEHVYVAIQNPEDQSAAQAVPKQWRWVTEQIQRELGTPKSGHTFPDQPLSDQPSSGAAPPGAAPPGEPPSGEAAETRAPQAPLEPSAPTMTARILEWVRGNADAISSRVFQTSRDALSAAANMAVGAGKLGFGAFLTAFFFYFISTQWSSVITFGDTLLPDDQRERAHELIGRFDRVVAGFVRGRLTIALIQSVIFAILYWIIGTPAPVLFGIVIGVLSIVPYLAIIGIPATIIAMWLDPAGGMRGQWWWIVVAPIVVYNLGQAADDYFLTPAIQGKSTDLDTPTILFASLAGGILFGFYGLLIAIPLAACIKIALREVFWPRFKAWAQGHEADFLPINRS